MIELFKIYWIFFKVGLFTIGGGLAALPLLQNEVLMRGWVNKAQFADMIAVSQSTPGPIGINMATYVGFNQIGIIGSVIATLGMVTPSIIIICIIAKFLRHFNENKLIQGVFVGLRPAVTGLIAAAAFSIASISMFNIELFKSTGNIVGLFNLKALILFGIFMYATNKWKCHPMLYIGAAGLVGMFIF
ncbi:chromate transporter [Paramaledivibacter caminithermalis]|jgi:chromate transporter|uniref:Chromate transporter n=1 Tax=Paramaledivibacter caminithermalis (strain DSM 15212 / CIP 107654 / DViRD3) TaxID=1121301 RepID=A0A1M6QZ08_PARC5|nr:chromate transporter [Paramaledivibacter caminithermalis]SHK25393.1 chromate transporter [Paramaledivibacter caminithermalis DSM 15212]